MIPEKASEDIHYQCTVSYYCDNQQSTHLKRVWLVHYKSNVKTCEIQTLKQRNIATCVSRSTLFVGVVWIQYSKRLSFNSTKTYATRQSLVYTFACEEGFLESNSPATGQWMHIQIKREAEGQAHMTHAVFCTKLNKFVIYNMWSKCCERMLTEWLAWCIATYLLQTYWLWNEE